VYRLDSDFPGFFSRGAERRFLAREGYDTGATASMSILKTEKASRSLCRGGTVFFDILLASGDSGVQRVGLWKARQSCSGSE